MDEKLKQRLVGMIVLVSLAVIFIPMLLDGDAPDPGEVTTVVETTPQKPGTAGDFSSHVVPLVAPEKIETVEDVDDATRIIKKGAGDAASLPMVGTGKRQPLPVAPAPSESMAEPETEAKPAPKPVVKPQPEPQPAPEKAAEKPPAVAKIDKPAPRPAPAEGGPWVVQVGAFAARANAEQLSDRLKKQGYSAFVIENPSDTGVLYRVRIGPEIERAKADAIRDNVETMLNMKTIVMPYP
jgi:DedD protein